MKKSPLKIELVQANPKVGDLKGNLKKVLDCLEKTQADLLVFPECFLTGYALQDLVDRPSFLRDVDLAIDELTQAVQHKGGPGVLIGAPLPGTTLPFNAAYLISSDGSRQVALKNELPNNDVFDERRTFDLGSNPKPLLFKDWKLGVMICEDMWHGRVSRALKDENAEVFIVLNGSPMEIDKQPIRHELARNRASSHGLPLIYLNLFGGQDELVFDGSSFVMDAQGHLIAQLPIKETQLEIEMVWDETHHRVLLNPIHINNPITPYPSSLEAIYHTLVIGLHDYVHKNGFEQILLGLSGGVDSALVAALAVDALGPEHLLAVMMPATYTGEESQSLAEQMANKLACRYINQPVGEIVSQLEKTVNEALVSPMIGVPPTPWARALASENIQARARGNFLMALSNALPGALVLSTGNKSEMSVGYATLYGDMCGGFNPIKDLYKTMVFDLCHWRNQTHLPWMKGPQFPIPERIITRPPTAELAADQSDEKSLGAYPLLDTVLKQLVEGMQSIETAVQEASRILGIPVNRDYVEKIAMKVQRAEYKRRQAPPGIKVTGRSFGFGWRYPITNGGKF